MRRVLKGDSIRHINKLVDAYNYASLKYRTPVGGEDLVSIKETVWLKFAEGDEHFVALGSADQEFPERREVVYVSGKEVLCRKWNWRESERTKLTENTENAILVIDVLKPLVHADVKKATEDLAALVTATCNADTKTIVLYPGNSKTNL